MRHLRIALAALLCLSVSRADAWLSISPGVTGGPEPTRMWVQGRFGDLYSTSVTLRMPIMSGDGLVCAVMEQGSDAPTVATENGDSMTLQLSTTNGRNRLDVFTVFNVTSGAQTITATLLPGGASPQIVCDEYSGVSQIDGSGTATQAAGSATDANSVSGAISNSGTIAWGVVAAGAYSPQTVSPGTGFVQRELDPDAHNWGLMTEDMASDPSFSAVTFTIDPGTQTSLLGFVGLF